MRKTVCTIAAIASLTAGAAFAGGMAEPMMEDEVMAPEVVVEESAGTSGGFVIPLLMLAIIAAVASGSGGDSDTDEVIAN